MNNTQYALCGRGFIIGTTFGTVQIDRQTAPTIRERFSKAPGVRHRYSFIRNKCRGIEILFELSQFYRAGLCGVYLWEAGTFYTVVKD